MKNLKEERRKELESNLNQFPHKISTKVKFADVDSFGVVHNIKYFYWLEWARTEFLRSIGVNLNKNTFLTELPLMVVHAEIDYFNSAEFDDEIEVFSRVFAVKDSSVVFENIIRKNGETLIANAKAVLVHIDPGTNQSIRIPDDLRIKIDRFQNDK